MNLIKLTTSTLGCALLAACGSATQPKQDLPSYYGTLEPFAENAVYFVVTDRFADGDMGNNYTSQGGTQPTFNQPLLHEGANNANVGYMGGDFQGIADNAAYISDMGFGALWLTPIVENPDEHFTGGDKVGEAFFADHGKTGYHGYWGVNFFEEDEHWISPGFKFKDLTHALDRYGLQTVLDIVANHGSPSFTMPVDQPMFGEIYDKQGELKADHQNLHPTQLDPNNSLHAWFHPEEDLAQLSNLNDLNPEVMEYFVAAYLQWVEQGADAFRIDTIRHMPNEFWREFAARIREQHPGFYMFGEHFSFEASDIAQHTFDEGGNISVLDFPGRKAMLDVFQDGGSMAALPEYLHLNDGVYANPYDLATFYDNHDMERINASDEGFINLHNWLFTSRGIPVIYYGSEVGFMRGAKEHFGNRNFWGQAAIDQAAEHPIHQALSSIANIRKSSIALQRGQQVNIDFGDDHAVFLRVYQHAGISQTALVLLNRADEQKKIVIDQFIQQGNWRDANTGESVELESSAELAIPANGFRVLLLNAPVEQAALERELCKSQQIICD